MKHIDKDEYIDVGVSMGRALAAADLTHQTAGDAAGIARSNVTRLCTFGTPARHWGPIHRLIINNELDLSFFYPDELILQAAESVRKRQRRESRRQTRAAKTDRRKRLGRKA
jgi:hypothetical protein